MSVVEQAKFPVFSRRKTLLSIGEKIDALELRKNIELSLIEDDEGKAIPIEQALKKFVGTSSE